MAESAVAKGGRVAVVVAVASTLTPTRQLLEECAAAAGTGAVILDAPCLNAWDLFETGDQAGYLDRIALHVRDLADDVDVVVLAQATMAAAAPLLLDLAIPVLSSPRPAVERAVGLVESQHYQNSTRAAGPNRVTLRRRTRRKGARWPAERTS